MIYRYLSQLSCEVPDLCHETPPVLFYSCLLFHPTYILNSHAAVARICFRATVDVHTLQRSLRFGSNRANGDGSGDISQQRVDERYRLLCQSG